MWKKANGQEAHSTSIDGVTVEHYGDTPDGDFPDE
jgi:hypothetical protein